MSTKDDVVPIRFVRESRYDLKGRRPVDISPLMSVAALRGILSLAGRYCDSGMLARGTVYSLPDHALRIRRVVARAVRRRYRCQSWPGTHCLDSRQLRRIYDFNPTAPVVAVLSAEYRPDEQGLEDLALIRPDGTAWFESVSHASLAYLNVDRQEWTRIASELGWSSSRNALWRTAGKRPPYFPGPQPRRGQVWASLRADE